MPIDVKEECLQMYQKLYRWHTEELENLESKLSQTDDIIERKKIEIVQKRLVVERKRIRKIYPEEFSRDDFDSKIE